MVYLTVHLYAKPGMAAALRAYEAEVLDLFRRHGGEVLAAFVPESASAGAEPPDGIPDEIQLLRISDGTRFQAFLNDPARLGLSGKRDAAIRRTDVFRSGRIIDPFSERLP